MVLTFGVAWLLTANVVDGTYFSSPFNYGWTTGGADFAGQHVEGIAATNGYIYVRGADVAYGSFSAIGRLGNTYTVNSGETLSGSFTADISGSAYVSGYVWCPQLPGIGSGSAMLTLRIRQLDSNGNNRVGNDIKSWTCNPFMTTVVTEWASGTAGASFAAGTSYKLVVEADLHGSALGTALSSGNFCSQIPNCGTGPNSIYVGGISVPNQVPKVALPVRERWYVYHAINQGTDVRGVGCDYDGKTDHTETKVGAWSGASNGAGAVCRSATAKVPLTALPGSYAFTVKSYDNEAAWGNTASGTWRLYLIPGECVVVAGCLGPFGAHPSSPVPDLRKLEDSALGRSVTYRAIIGPGDEIRGARLTGATVLGDTLSGIVPGPSDHEVLIEFDRTLSFATLAIDGVATWAGRVVQSGPHWYDIAPAATEAPPVVPAIGNALGAQEPIPPAAG